MSVRYRTVEGDALDAICHQHYRRESAVAAVLEANPGLADLPCPLPAGIVITLPPLPDPEPDQPIRLWD